MLYKSLIALLMLMLPTSAFAYIGPGMGVGTIASVLGVLAAIFLALVGILYYPIKRILKKKRNKNAANSKLGE